MVGFGDVFPELLSSAQAVIEDRAKALMAMVMVWHRTV
jgi:hypothetical protein